MARGDLLFYHAGGSLPDAVISAATASSFVHVEIDDGAGESYGALSSGIGHYPQPQSGQHISRWSTSSHVDAASLNRAMAWAAIQVGRPYGWLDCVDGGLRDVLTGLPGGLAGGLAPAVPVLAIPGAWDCSSFATRFLTTAGYALPDGLAQNPDAVTPGDLAHALGVQ